MPCSASKGHGRPPPKLDGTWTLQITSVKNETFTPPTPPPLVLSVALNFSSGNDPGFNPTTMMPVPAVVVADNISTMEALSPNANPAATPTYVVNS